MEEYLLNDYPAPKGHFQRAYEARLFQAGLLYICRAWYSYEDGVAKDFLKLEETKKKYPDFPERVIATTLELHPEPGVPNMTALKWSKLEYSVLLALLSHLLQVHDEQM